VYVEEVDTEVNESETVVAKVMVQDCKHQIDVALQVLSPATHTTSAPPPAVVASPPAAVAKTRLPKLNLVRARYRVKVALK